LFVADHRALDFLNTRAEPDGITHEWLADGDDLVAWLEAAKMLDASVRRHLPDVEPAALDAAATEARTLREWLRGMVNRYAGHPLPRRAVRELAPLNAILATDRMFVQVEPGAANEDQPFIRRFDRPQDLRPDMLLPVTEAIADLVVDGDFTLVKPCASPRCTLHFYDRTRAHSRRWCTMAVCGNRAKAAAHRSRHTPPTPRPRA
jgi:predicted RNA-binding Zn ribbon-like protein